MVLSKESKEGPRAPANHRMTGPEIQLILDNIDSIMDSFFAELFKKLPLLEARFESVADTKKEFGEALRRFMDPHRTDLRGNPINYVRMLGTLHKDNGWVKDISEAHNGLSILLRVVRRELEGDFSEDALARLEHPFRILRNFFVIEWETESGQLSQPSDSSIPE
jgi:hypothetical protein